MRNCASFPGVPCSGTITSICSGCPEPARSCTCMSPRGRFRQIARNPLTRSAATLYPAATSSLAKSVSEGSIGTPVPPTAMNVTSCPPIAHPSTTSKSPSTSTRSTERPVATPSRDRRTTGEEICETRPKSAHVRRSKAERASFKPAFAALSIHVRPSSSLASIPTPLRNMTPQLNIASGCPAVAAAA